MSSNLSRRALLKSSAAFAAGLPMIVKAAQANGPLSLESGFLNPPNSAKPRVWWHWMNGNVTREGIDADFAWMQRTGIGGVQNFDASLRTPQVVQKRIVGRTPEWADSFAMQSKRPTAKGSNLPLQARRDGAKQAALGSSPNKP
ncbi:MAG: hypothetical protein HC843_07490 [Sphingomonadales bacterium]|nr:hypothetical protein [Sphingomonadales bacterium]